MSIVLDTNVIVSALVFGGKSRLIIDLIIEQEITGCITEEIIQEVLETLSCKFNQNKPELEVVENLLRNVFTLVTIKTKQTISRDPDDDHILAITHSVKINYIVSGDKDLLSLSSYNGVSIVTPGQLLALDES